RLPDARPIQYITHCPECGAVLERNEGEAKHFCPNNATCPPQILGRIEHFVSKRAMDIDSLGTERIRALIDQGYIANPADIYDLVSKKEALLGLEINTEQYIKNTDGHLYIALRKALFGLTEGISLTLIDNFLSECEDVDQKDKLSRFLDFAGAQGTRSSSNRTAIQTLKQFMSLEKFEIIEDFIPLAVVVSVLMGKESVDPEIMELAKGPK